MPLVVRRAALVLTADPERSGPLGALEGAALALEGGRIVWIGDDREAPDGEVLDASHCVVLPGLVDCHTHLVWGGDRSDEFRRRLAGESYSAILEAGGGILSTVRATRAASEEALETLAVARLQAMRARGVTTVEAKSGYGLDPTTEARILRVAQAAAVRADVRVLGTFLGAHAIPAEWRHDRAAYVRQVIEAQLPAVLPWAHAIDAYVDRGAFTLEEGLEILAAGRAAGLHVRVHAEQVTHTGIAAAAAGIGA
ncbi:MAG: amidohydrolase family protein, partial [Deltaproteobacteria bacterium]|nr:amidohydrolase family protein [Deltaproteobacteria bacterium]